MSINTDDLEYSLAKRIPDMERGFTIETSYGPIHIDADQAAMIIRATSLALTKALTLARRCEVAHDA